MKRFGPAACCWQKTVVGLTLSLLLAPAHGALFSSTLPSSRSAEVGAPVSFFGTVINAGTATATDCRVDLVSAIPATLTYQRTDPTTNAPIGTADTPSDIAAGASQSYVLTLTATQPVDPTEVALGFVCANDGPAVTVSGLNTLFFSASNQATPDMIALAATLTQDGISVLPATATLGFFSVATINLGAAGSLDVAPRASGMAPSTLLVCETNPLTGACLGDLAASTTATVAENGTPTFAVFLDADETVPFDPAGNRIFLDFSEGGLLRGSTSVAFKSATSEDWFESNISAPIVQSKCINCHVVGGPAQDTPLNFEPATNPDFETLNRLEFEAYLENTPGAADRILNKVQGALGHGGGAQIQSGTAEFDDLSAFLELLGEDIDDGPTPATLFSNVTLADREATLRRAALVLAGRMPTATETAQAVDDASLKQAIRGLMTGDGFHAFLIEGGNDRLLTDRQFQSQQTIDPTQPFFVDVANLNHAKLVDAQASGDSTDYQHWYARIQRGFARAPLELIAWVAENDRPYTEILTANYVMANPMAAEGYGDDTVAFDDPTDANEFKPATIRSFYRNDDSMVLEYDFDTQLQVIDPGNLQTDLPQAGVLNTMAFLTRYPSTATNRNRARARWTYYHFLDLDIEKSAPRTTDPDALADTNNPTMNNSACTVCHVVMDPLAGAFQNYGDEGNYRRRYGGFDSLDPTYKFEPGSPYVFGDTWYRDMRTPGFDGEAAPDASNSLQWLAGQLVADDRFAVASVKFWWPALMGTEALEAPSDASDPGFEGRLLAFNAQGQELERLADAFRAGIDGGPAYNLMDLLVEMVMSSWFRAASHTETDAVKLEALADAGVERMLTPEQLARKTAALTGVQWGRFFNDYLGMEHSHLTRDYRLYYGGIDSDGVTDRAGDITATMAAVAQSHAAELACPVTMRELFILPDGERRLFAGIDRQTTPETAFSASREVAAASWADRQTYAANGTAGSGSGFVTIRFENDFFEAGVGDRNLALDTLTVRDAGGSALYSLELETLPETPGAVIGCGSPTYNPATGQTDHFVQFSSCTVTVPYDVPVTGSYTVEVVGWAQQAGPDNARMELALVEAMPSGNAAGAMEIKTKLVELFDVLLGVETDVADPEVVRAYDLFVAVQDQHRQADPLGQASWFPGPGMACAWWADARFFEGIVDDARIVDAEGQENWDFAKLDAEVWDVLDFSDSTYGGKAWMAVIAYLLGDYRYVYL